ncbi:MAG TPA: TIR domain-containing protein [Candidatus Binatia bacterium]|jgi:CheY-like chemotaxis protein
MARITIIDDDFSIEILAENLRYFGHDVSRIASAKDALNALDSIVSSDLLVLDIIMERPPDMPGGDVSGGRTTGMSIFERIRQKRSDLPILAYSATSDRDVINALGNDRYTRFLSKWSTPSLKEIIAEIENILGLDHFNPLPRPFIVHGHDEATKLAVKNYLQNTLNLPEPIVLHEQPNLGRTLIEKFEYYAAQSQLAFVLLTPDDRVAPANTTDDEKRRARQNVILELGFFLGSLGRSSGRVFLLYKGPLELPSDLSGVIYVDITNGIDAAGEEIRKELQHVLR